MKFLEYTPFDRLNDFWNNLNLGERTISGYLEAYSCKHTTVDKRLSVSLEHEILDYLEKSSDTEPCSSQEYLCSRSGRRTLIYLILTLYNIYPDYDFSAVKAHQCFVEEEWENFKQIFDTYMLDASKEWCETNGESVMLLETVYAALDEVVKLEDCEMYSYSPDRDADPLMDRGAIWSFSFFFYNRKLKRVVNFRFCCVSNIGAEADSLGNQYDGYVFDDMDM